MPAETLPVILIVDDNPTNLGVLFNYLRTLNFKVFPIKNATKALNFLQKQKADLILLDIMMPGIDGYEMCRRLKADSATKDIPVIFMSALSETVDKVKGFQMGAVDYVTKPFQQEEILMRINTHLQLRMTQKQLEAQNKALEKIQKQITYDLDMAYNIQRGLLRPARADYQSLNLVCYTQSARQIGGDFYTYRFFPQANQCSFVVGDVSGKGIPAALLMATCLSQFDAHITPDILPEEFIRVIDKAFTPYMKPYNQNCAMIYGQVKLANNETSSDFIQAEFFNAGCVMPLIRWLDGRVEWLEIGGIPLGMGLGNESGYTGITLTLQTGDMIILCSDGVIEAMNERREMFGFEQLYQTVMAFSPINPTDSKNQSGLLVKHIKNRVQQFIGGIEPHDDLTIMVIQV